MKYEVEINDDGMKKIRNLAAVRQVPIREVIKMIVGVGLLCANTTTEVKECQAVLRIPGSEHVIDMWNIDYWKQGDK